jgi:hypothetical protein
MDSLHPTPIAAKSSSNILTPLNLVGGVFTSIYSIPTQANDGKFAVADNIVVNIIGAYTKPLGGLVSRVIRVVETISGIILGSMVINFQNSAQDQYTFECVINLRPGNLAQTFMKYTRYTGGVLNAYFVNNSGASAALNFTVANNIEVQIDGGAIPINIQTWNRTTDIK